MKNAAESEQIALRARAASVAARLPQMTRSQDGRLTDESRQAFAACAQRVLRQNRAVGAAIVLTTPCAQDVFCFGQARLAPRMPVTPQTCFRVASVSKLVMAFGALSLVQDGLLDLDADVSAYLGYRVASPASPVRRVTPRMLLTHTSGLCDEGNYGTRGMQAGCTLRELLENPQNWLPSASGERFHYSNLGAGAMGVIMEHASGMAFDDLMQRRVFEPLAIRASYDPQRIAPAAELADGYAVRACLPPRRRYDAAALTRAPRPASVPSPEADYLIAAGRMITDSAGMAQLLRLLASHGEMGVLSADMLNLMRRPQDGIGGIVQAKRGLNVALLPDVFAGFSPVGHQGVAYGMVAELFADPASGCGVGVMTNGARLTRTPPLMRVGFDLLALGFGAMAKTQTVCVGQMT